MENLDGTKHYLICGREFYLPKEIDYVQLKEIKNIFDISKIDIGSLFNGGKVDIKSVVSSILDILVEKDLIPELFATLLIPKGQPYWEEKYKVENLALMKRVGDITMAEVVTSFLSGRESLVYTIMDFLTNFLAKLKVSEKK